MAQSLSQLWIHVIFSTKERYPYLNNLQIREQLYKYLNEICYRNNCKAIAIGGTEDHIHLLTSLYKNIALSDIIEEIKKSTSKWLKTLSNVENNLNKFYWQRGYGAFSVSQSKIDIVKRYIENQHIHHQKKNFQDELRIFLTQHHVSYQEEYLWD